MQKRFFTMSRFFAIVFAVVIGLAAYTDASARGGDKHWGYEGAEGPEHWGELSKKYKACSEGEKQSPIDITGAKGADLKNIKFDYKPSKINILNNGHTIQVNYDKGSSITVDGTEFKLLQFHFHTPSEHVVRGGSYDMEMHLVHKSNKGELAVVGVLVREGEENPAFADMWGHLPERASTKKSLRQTVNAADLLPGHKAYFKYSGSLTTPPCSEGVKWHVLTTPIEMSAGQIEAIEAIMHENNRPVQPLNERSLEKDVSRR
jgi:carbonic anhydrase